MRPIKKFIDRADCHTEHSMLQLSIRSRRHPVTKEKFDRPVSLARIFYVEAHDLELTDLDGYMVFHTRNYCGTPNCANPEHWMVAPLTQEDPMPPWWLDL